MNNPILNMDEKLEKIIKRELEELERLMGAQAIFCLITNAVDRTVICNKRVIQMLEYEFLKELYDGTMNATFRLEERYERVAEIPLDDIYEMNKNRYYVIPVAHYEQGGGIQDAQLGIQFDGMVQWGYVKSNVDKVKQTMEELQTQLELLFLKADNYFRMYKLLEVFENLAGEKSSRLPFHMNNVASWSQEIGRKLNMGEEELMNLYFAALAHDIGSIYVDEGTLNKREALLPEEYEKIKGHPEKGEQLFQLCALGIPSLAEIPSYIRHHHERWDGKGYPDGLSGNAIPRISQIIGIGDAVESMLSERAFSTQKTIHEVKAELAKGAGTQFNPELVEIMMKLLDHNRIHVDHNFVFHEMMVLNHVAIGVELKDDPKSMKLYGKLIVNGKDARIELNGEDRVELNNIHSIKIAFFDRKKLFEFVVHPSEITEHTLLIEEMNQIPADKLYSLYWDMPVEIGISKKTIHGKALRVGGEGLAVLLGSGKADDEARNELISQVGTSVSLKLYFELEEISLIILQASIAGYYKLGDKYVFLLKYSNPPREVVDKIVRLLFRKQMANKAT